MTGHTIEFDLHGPLTQINDILSGLKGKAPALFNRSPTSEIALCEALSNAIKHSTPRRAPGQVGVEMNDNSCKVTVSNTGHKIHCPDDTPKRTALRDAPETGYSLHLIKNIASDVKFLRKSKTNHVEMVFNF